MKSQGQFNFAWIFALIVGGSILVLAIYGAVSAGNTQREITDTKIARSFSIITDPLQAGFSDGSYDDVEFGDVTRLNNYCFDIGFGSNKISISTRSDILSEWNPPGVETSIENKYIFSKENSEGKIYHSFSKPFYFPYKVSDLIFLSPDEYCFVSAPEHIIEEVGIAKNINVDIGCEDDENLIKVCFGSGSGSKSNCDMNVYGSCRTSSCNSIYDEGTVSKKGSELKYVSSLMYGAIFADEEMYTCNVNRLLYRTGRIAEVLSKKADLMNRRGCNTNLRSEIAIYGERVIDSSYKDLQSIDYFEIDRQNDLEVCGLWN
ncbi:MAG: hypothetical protein IH845_01680 [Nanoarchaeota archaeon]|nr:hypothetical protein [Nanoarchaeota archaeon]